MRKLTTLIIALISLSAYAYGGDHISSCCDTKYFASGIYTGGHIGLNHIAAKRLDASRPDVGNISDIDGQLNSIDFSIGGHFGYLWVHGNLAYGPEVFIDYSKNSNDHGNVFHDYKYKTKQDLSFGGKLRVGYILNDSFFLYGLVGAKTTRTKLTVTDLNESPAVNTSKTEYLPGLLYGIGIEKALDQCNRLRLELTQTHYKSKEFRVRQTQGTPTTHTSTYSPKITEITLGYSFAF